MFVQNVQTVYTYHMRIFSYFHVIDQTTFILYLPNIDPAEIEITQ